MNDDPADDIRRLGRKLLDNPSITHDLDQAVEDLHLQHQHLNPCALRAALMHALSTAAAEATRDLISEARHERAPWKDLAATLGLSISGVRTRFHEPTVEARQRYESKRERPPRRTPPPTSDA